jgi:hypothetical protein
MTHIAIQEALNGKPVEWMEKVSDEQYREESRKHKISYRWRDRVFSCGFQFQILLFKTASG